MNEQLLANYHQQLAETLLAIKKSGDWKPYATWEYYVQKRWSLSKSRAELLCKFAKFCGLCRAQNYRMPDSPENVKPILALAQKRWIDAWALCVQYADGPINAGHCEATLAQFGFITRKKLPPHVLNGQRVRKAAKLLAGVEDGERLVEEGGARVLGKEWDTGIRHAIDIDQAKWNRERGNG